MIAGLSFRSPLELDREQGLQGLFKRGARFLQELRNMSKIEDVNPEGK
jgi:hypothetical protein